ETSFTFLIGHSVCLPVECDFRQTADHYCEANTEKSIFTLKLSPDRSHISIERSSNDDIHRRCDYCLKE
ncbi:hypothetical protein PFISCL1PPCAC_15335, partial [Pristionchus fissidentatus]